MAGSVLSVSALSASRSSADYFIDSGSWLPGEVDTVSDALFVFVVLVVLGSFACVVSVMSVLVLWMRVPRLSTVLPPARGRLMNGST